MGFLRHIRSKSKLKNQPEAQVYGSQTTYAYMGRTAAGYLPQKVLNRLFAYVCPHSTDETYLSCEASPIEEGCMLCQMRDLAHCALMNKAWADAARSRLYHSVRIDAVHYCEREVDLSEKRKHKHRFERNGDPGDTTQQRLALFCRTVRSNGYLGSLVEILKMPYMTRESSKADLARTVSALPNLRYVDLPDGFFHDESSTATLRQELQANCPDIRKMKYLHGSENSFTMLGHMRMWQSLESLEITGLAMEADALLWVLASFPALKDVKLGGNMVALNDEMFIPNPSTALFPPISHLALDSVPGVTAQGLVAYLSRPETREVLTHLSLSGTGVIPQELHAILASAPRLRFLSIAEVVSKPFPITPIPPMKSRSLQSLAFEILPEQHGPNPASETFYNYLASSLLSGSLPALTSCYAYSPSLPDLLLAPPLPQFTGNFSQQSGRPSSSSGMPVQLPQRFSTMSLNPPGGGSVPPFAPQGKLPSFAPQSSSGRPTSSIPMMGLQSRLELFTKSAEAPELEWNLTTIDPPSEHNQRRGSASATRPLSLVLSEGGRGGGLKSPGFSSGRGNTKVVGNGFGGFLSVPGDDSGQEGSWGHARASSRGVRGEWMG